MASSIEAEYVYHDGEEYAEVPLEAFTVDRLLLDGDHDQQQLELNLRSDGPRKKRRKDICGSGDDEPEPEAEPDPLNDEEDNDDHTPEDDGADALIAEFGGEESWLMYHNDTGSGDDDESLDRMRQERKMLRAESCNSILSGRETSLTSSMVGSSVAEVLMEGCEVCGRMEHPDFSQQTIPIASREYLDLHIRAALSVRVVEVESVLSNSQFVLRVEDGESKKKWDIRKSFKEMAQFYTQIQQISMTDAPVKRGLWGTFRPLRRFRLPMRYMHTRGTLCQQRKLVFDSFLRQTAALVLPAPLGPRRRRAVLMLQEFVGVHRHCNIFERGGGCKCVLLREKLNAKQLVAEIFANPNHKVSKECAEFVTTLTQKSIDARHNRLSTRKAQAILQTVSRKMAELKKLMVKDHLLLQQLALTKQELLSNEDEYDEFVDEIRHEISGFVQLHVLVPLEDHIYESLHALHPEEDEIRLKNKIRLFQTKPQSFFGIPKHIRSSNDWEEARRELHRIDDYSLPLDKLRCIVRSASAIFRSRYTQSASSGDSLTSVEQLEASMTTEEFIPVFLFVLVTSNNAKMLITKDLLGLMCDAQDVTGEIGYYLTNYEASIDLVQRHTNVSQPILR